MTNKELFTSFAKNARDVYEERKYILALEHKIKECSDLESLKNLQMQMYNEIRLFKELLDVNHYYSRQVYYKKGIKMGFK